MLGSEDATQTEEQEEKILCAQLSVQKSKVCAAGASPPPVEAVSPAALYTPVLVTQLGVYPQLDS